MTKLNTKLTKTKTYPFHKVLTIMACFILNAGALGWLIWKCFKCKGRLEAVTDNYKHSEEENRELREANERLRDNYKRLVKIGGIYVDGSVYKIRDTKNKRLIKRDSYLDCLK